MADDTMDKLLCDCQHTIDQFKMLADIRFKLLAFFPTLSGAAIAYFAKPDSPEVSLVVVALGFFVTTGITFYDIRNTQFYDAAVHRARWLESILDLPICTQDEMTGGLFNERPRHKLKYFGIIEIWHDRGLSFAYGAALGGWSYIIVISCLHYFPLLDKRFVFLVAAMIGLLCSWQYQRLSGKNKPVPNENLMNEIEACHKSASPLTEGKIRGGIEP